MAAAAGVALGLRLYLLSRPGYLTGITEYDDGVYLGGALRLLSGALPYHDYAFVQPPGILLLMTPVAALAKLSGAASAMAAARLLTASASAASVVLAGALVRYRGTLVTATTCALLAVYPDDIAAAHTLLLEPWMNLLLLAGAGRAFREGRLRGPRALLCAGVLFGLAGAVKYWAAIPALGLLVVCLAVSRPGPSRAGQAGGSRAGGGSARRPGSAAAPSPPSPWPWRRSRRRGRGSSSGQPCSTRRPGPGRPSRSHCGWPTSPDLACCSTTRDGSPGRPRPRCSPGATSPPRRPGPPAGCRYCSPSPAPRRRPASATARAGCGPLGWYAAGVLAATAAAVLGYSAFFYHYGDFAAPWLALSAGFAVAGLRERAARLRLRSTGQRERSTGQPAGSGHRRRAGVALTAAVLAVAAWQGWQLSGLHAADVGADAALIPPGACVVTDEISLAVAASRFTAGQAGCPDVLDSLATTLVAGNGVSVQGGAERLPPVVRGLEADPRPGRLRVAVVVERPPDPVDRRSPHLVRPHLPAAGRRRRGRPARDSCTSGADRGLRVPAKGGGRGRHRASGGP